MRETLYISDLDGTLLNNQKEITKETAQILNELIHDNINFAIATARTAATVEGLMTSIKVNIPVVLMNGVALYDLQKHIYIDVEYISEQSVKYIKTCLSQINESGFIYTINEGRLSAYYNKTLNKYEQLFYDERKQRKNFYNIEPVDNTKIAYFIFMDVKERIEAIAEAIKDVQDIDFVLYKDNYMEDAYLLEVYSNKASKANGVRKLKEKYGYKKIVCFGDNLNDLTMFRISDYSCAMANAVKEVKAVATEVIESNEQDGVARFIKNQVFHKI